MLNNSKNVKRIISISAAAVCMISSLRVAPAAYFEADAADELTAWEITEEMKIGWNLGNTLDAKASDAKGNELASAGLETETSWGQPKASEELILAIKEKGFNTVRIPTTWFQHLDSEDNIDPEWMARVHEVVDYAYKNDMYVILNLHHENWVNRSDIGTAYDEMKPRLVKLWTQIATEFKDYDQHLIFEGMNEPRAAGTPHEWWGPQDNEVETINKLDADFVNTIRSIDSPYKDTRLLMIPGYCAASDVSMISLIDVPDDDYVAVSIHAYVPYNFTMNPGADGFHETFTDSFSAELSGILDGIRQTFTNKDIPVVIGEFGTSNYDNTEARVKWATQYMTTTKKYGIPCVLWDNNVEKEVKQTGEAHGYINRNTLEWYTEPVKVVDTMMSVINDDSIVWGSERHLPVIAHKSLDEGTAFIDKAVEIDASKSKTYENTTPGKDMTWAELEGKEVAIKYTGTTPLLAFSDDAYGNWTELKPYSLDDENGIAYYLVSEQLPNAWGKSTDSIAHMQARTEKVTTIEKIVLLDAPEGEIEVPVDKTKKFKTDITNAGDADYELTICFTGTGADGKAGGTVGFMDGEDWKQVDWTGAKNADGAIIVTVPMDKIPESVKQAEIQVWWSDDETLDLASAKIEKKAAETTTIATTEPVVTEVTTTETTVSADDKDYVAGDANCDKQINLADTVMIMQALVNPDKYGINGSDASHITKQGWANADCCNKGDGVTNNDALVIQMLRLDLIKSLPTIYAE